MSEDVGTVANVEAWVARRAARWPVWARRLAGRVFTRRVTVSCDGCGRSVALRGHVPSGVEVYLTHPQHSLRAAPPDPAAAPYDRTDVWLIGTNQRRHP
jgi:hypothetical protein